MKDLPVDDAQYASLEVLQYYLKAGLEKLQSDPEVMALYKTSDSKNMVGAY